MNIILLRSCRATMDQLTMDRDHLALIMQRIKSFQQQQQLAEPAKRPAAFPSSHDQPLDFSAPSKKFCPSPDWAGHGYNLSLGSDGHSDRDQSGSISPTGSQRSTDSDDKPTKGPLAGSCSPPRPALARISIPTLSPTSSPSSKADLLTTAPPFSHVSLRPLSSLQPQHHDIKPLLNLPFLPHASLPFPFHPSLPQYLPSPSPSSDLVQITRDSQNKFEEYRNNMLRNMDSNQDKFKTETEHYSPSPVSPTPSSHNASLPCLSLTPTHSSTPSRGDDKGKKDSAYWERRRKNNAAAKRSRDTRRAKENDIAIRCSFLEQENVELKMKLVKVITELQASRDCHT